MPIVTDNGTPASEAGLPAIFERRRTGWTGGRRIETDPAFVSQLIAERDHLPSQRQRRRAPLDTAIEAYGLGERSDRHRLPHGFFRTSEA